LLADSLPEEQAARDAAVVRLVGGEQVQTDGLGGGNPTTCKVVVVKPVPNDTAGLILDYCVGNIVIGNHAVDWRGTCGNMTATVPLYALEEHIIPASWHGPLRLRNTSTGGMIETFIAGMGLHEPGQEAVVTTRYLDPAGAVLGFLLPTGAGIDRISSGSSVYQASLVDVTHPYLFLLYEEVVGNGDVRNPDTLKLIERLRAEMCVRLGLAASPDDAARSSPAVPRIVLVHQKELDDNSLRISAISMGQPIATVPVTAAMCLAAACQIPSTLLARKSADHSGEGKLTVISPGARLSASAAVGANGNLASVSVDRTARTIMRGTAWI
jgi:2-methylaconitate cis-trans-isomerase PrpF